MKKEETTPSESEWIIMEVLWASSIPLTSQEIIRRVQDKKMSAKTVRVLLNRLRQKGIVDYLNDKEDARVYHYFALKTKGDCEKEKSRRFVESYFAGNQTNALAALLQSCILTDEQIEELEDILEQSKGRDDT